MNWHDHAQYKHHRAMDWVELAIAACAKSNPEIDRLCSRRAATHEIQAARLWAANSDGEPTRSILFRSAASLAERCGRHRLVLRLVKRGMVAGTSGCLAEEMAELKTRAEARQANNEKGVSK